MNEAQNPWNSFLWLDETEVEKFAKLPKATFGRKRPMHISINQVNREILSTPEYCEAYSLARIERQQRSQIHHQI